jgi:hypothetical protein
MSRPKSGGGLTSSKLVERKYPKAEPIPHAINPAAVSQIGVSVDPRAVEKLDAGKGYRTPVGPSSNMGQGPGANREVFRSGSQGTHGPVRQGEKDYAPDVPASKPGRDILSQYGGEGRK